MHQCDNFLREAYDTVVVAVDDGVGTTRDNDCFVKYYGTANGRDLYDDIT
jgi:hypothetical protein